MQNSKQKSKCAYAKTGKSKAKNQSIKNQNTLSPRNKKNQYIYEELMNELDIDQSQYIERLCKKNQEKMKKNQKITMVADQHFKDISNILYQSPRISAEKIKNQQLAKSKSNITSPSLKSSIRSKDSTTRIKNGQHSRQKFITTSQQSQSIKQRKPHQHFLSHLDNYIEQLKEDEQKCTRSFLQHQKINKYQSQDEHRQFRRTVELPSSKMGRIPHQSISEARYMKLLDKLHEELVSRQALEYKLQCKDLKMNHMKSIILEMQGRLLQLQKQLRFQKQQKRKYSAITQEFVSKVYEARSKSREKQHQKRNTHIPSSSSFGNDFSSYLNKGQFKEMMIRKEFQKQRKKDQINTLKKRGMHKYKASNQVYFEGKELQSRASIYHDSYL